MEIIAIVAYDKNRGIGNGGKIPWKIPGDLKNFRNTTLNNFVLMGRATWDSLPRKPLKDRHNIVISRTLSGENDKVHFVPSIQDAISLIKADKAYVIGGEQIYTQFLEQDLIDTVLATEINVTYKTDTKFPVLLGDWSSRLVESCPEYNIVEYKKIKNKLADIGFLKNRNFKLAFANGCFDLFHAGHVEVFKFAKQFGKVVVALNSDASITRLKGADRPIFTLEQRTALITALQDVDYVISFDEDTPLNLIKEIKPDFIIKGQDYEAKNVVGSDIVGVENVKTCKLHPDLSTSKIIDKIKGLSKRDDLALMAEKLKLW